MASVDERLHRHLQSWLGRWPPTRPVDVVASLVRERPGWDDQVRALAGVGTPERLVLSVPPRLAAAVQKRAAGDDWASLRRVLPELLGQPGRQVYQGSFRWCEQPAGLPDAGSWVDAGDPAVPQWLRPFGHQVLIAEDPATGAYLAGVGIKYHDRYGRELAVGTEPAARGRGLARRLVAQAARRVLAEGAVPTYQHDPENVASARVADAAGFPDRGWWSVGLW